MSIQWPPTSSETAALFVLVAGLELVVCGLKLKGHLYGPVVDAGPDCFRDTAILDFSEVALLDREIIDLGVGSAVAIRPTIAWCVREEGVNDGQSLLIGPIGHPRPSCTSEAYGMLADAIVLSVALTSYHGIPVAADDGEPPLSRCGLRQQLQVSIGRVHR